jgi:hypothetical protein
VRFRYVERDGQRVLAREVVGLLVTHADLAEAHSRLLARTLAETWQEFDDMRKAGHFGAIKAGPQPGSMMTSPGRGPSGKLRNFGAMSEEKLMHTLNALRVHGEDPEAHLAAMGAAAGKLGVKFNPHADDVSMPAKVAGVKPSQLVLA